MKGNQFIEDDIVNQLGEQCELLYYRFIGLDDNQHTTKIPLEAKSFYLEEDRETWVTKEDVVEFLRGACANVSLLHVYIK